MTAVLTAARRTFAALSVRNYRLYAAGQAISATGLWMRVVAQGWLVLKLTGSGTALGLVVAAQFLPVLVGGPLGGVIVDRFDNRRLIVFTHTVMALLALALGVLTTTGVVQVWMILVIAFLLGCVAAIDNPARLTFVNEMVGPAHLVNAVSLNSVLMNGARVVGPSVAALLIARVGIGPAFLVNAATYLAVIAALLAMRTGELHPVTREPPRRGMLREGLVYVWKRPELRLPLVMMAVMGTLTYEDPVTLPLLARNTFHAGAEAYGAMTAAMGAGAVIGGLVIAFRAQSSLRVLVAAAAVFGMLLLAVAAAPSLAVALAILPFVGAASLTFISVGNATLQLTAAPEMRGRVMALFGVAFLGATPIGGPVVGYVGEHLGARAAVGLGGLAAVLTAAWAAWSLRGLSAGRDPAQVVSLPDRRPEAEAPGPSVRSA